MYEVFSDVFENACKYHPVNGLFLVFLCKQTRALNCDSASHIYYFYKLRPAESCTTITRNRTPGLETCKAELCLGESLI